MYVRMRKNKIIYSRIVLGTRIKLIEKQAWNFYEDKQDVLQIDTNYLL